MWRMSVRSTVRAMNDLLPLELILRKAWVMSEVLPARGGSLMTTFSPWARRLQRAEMSDLRPTKFLPLTALLYMNVPSISVLDAETYKNKKKFAQ